LQTLFQSGHALAVNHLSFLALEVGDYADDPDGHQDGHDGDDHLGQVHDVVHWNVLSEIETDRGGCFVSRRR
jgi:hypothetical protein